MRRLPRTRRKAGARRVDLADPSVLYPLYEAAVQAPDAEADAIDQIYRALNGRPARSLREDFCGTFMISCEWVRKGRDRTALGLDLDASCLESGARRHLPRLSASQRARVSTRLQNVISVTPPVDVVAACNFSWYTFRERAQLLEYFRAAHKSLAPGGVLALDIVGGPDFELEQSERSRKRVAGLGSFTYIWELEKFDPVHRRGQWAIHFTLAGGIQVKRAFTYDWRIWTIPETRDLLREAGFSDTQVFWEHDARGREGGLWKPVEQAPADECWISYVVGRKAP
ncbi:MAG: class I SAM-dependent methyltransferase [Bdellovibrionales bacterium]|nr:class I SAM-dependent methyltransferase [Bdellovibrionales bacterium]